MAGLIDLRELDAELTKTRTRFDDWASANHTIAKDSYTQHKSNLQDQAGKISSLQADYQHAQLNGRQVKQRLEKEDQEIAALHSASAALISEREALNRKLGSMKDSLQLQEQDCIHTETEASVEDNQKRKRLSALKQALHVYSSRLGMEFKQGADDLVIEMSQVQVSNPQRVFTIAVRILTDNTYEVTKCEPHIDTLPAMLQHLNTSNDFSEFVKAVRRGFQRSCS